MVDRYNRKDGVEDGTLQDKNGRWVEYSDYAELEAENQKLRDAGNGILENMYLHKGRFMVDKKWLQKLKQALEKSEDE